MKEKNVAKKFLGNSGWMIGQQMYNMLLQLVVGSLSARYLGPSNYGLINYGASIISFFSIVCRLGLDSVIINEMINDYLKLDDTDPNKVLQWRKIVASLPCGFCLGATIK